MCRFNLLTLQRADQPLQAARFLSVFSLCEKPVGLAFASQVASFLSVFSFCEKPVGFAFASQAASFLSVFSLCEKPVGFAFALQAASLFVARVHRWEMMQLQL